MLVIPTRDLISVLVLIYVTIILPLTTIKIYSNNYNSAGFSIIMFLSQMRNCYKRISSMKDGYEQWQFLGEWGAPRPQIDPFSCLHTLF